MFIKALLLIRITNVGVKHFCPYCYKPLLAVRAWFYKGVNFKLHKMSNDIEQRKEDFETIYFGEIGMCGCGQPEDVKKFIYELLKNHKECKDEKITYKVMAENRKRIIKETDTDVVFEFVFHILEHNDLLEHGGSVYGSWFTEKGEKFFDLLSENLSDDDAS